jgi:hypothetical protein
VTLVMPAAGAYAWTFDRAMALAERGPKTTDAPAPAQIIVAVKTLVVRTDLGPNRFTLVQAGDAVPAGLEGFPRVPA